jgi:sugar phosphate isomerase/epimerase
MRISNQKVIGLSTTYYATKGLSIYDSALRTVELGFEAVEFGAAHLYEDNVYEVLRKVKRDFPRIIFTIHTLFPPLRNKVWFNPAEGLSELNKMIVDGLIKAATVLGAKIISIHPPILNKLELGEKVVGNFNNLRIGSLIDEEVSRNDFACLLEYVINKAEKSNTRVIIENLNTSKLKTFLDTRESFLSVFSRFKNTGLCLDVAHALECGNLDNLMGLDGNIIEVHLHEWGYSFDGRARGHLPIKDIAYFEPLKEIIKKDSVICIFEHGADVMEEDILKEKSLLERFLGL